MSNPPALHAPQQLLIVKTSSLGDVVHALPAISDVKLRYPDLQIDWVVEDIFAEIPPLHPGIRQTIPVALRSWRQQWFSLSAWRALFEFRRNLAQRPYDMVLDLQGLLKSSMISSWSRGSRHGLDWSSAREPLATYGYQHRHCVPRQQHAIDRNRQLAAAALQYSLPVPVDYGLGLSRQTELSDPHVVLLHSTSRDDKLWPEENWCRLIEHYSQRGYRCLLPWGSAAEEARSKRLATPHTVLLPRLPLRTLAEYCASAVGVVGLDTGLTHLAAAVGVPVIAIFSGSDPELTGVRSGTAPVINIGAAGKPPAWQEVLEASDRLFIKS